MIKNLRMDLRFKLWSPATHLNHWKPVSDMMSTSSSMATTLPPSMLVMCRQRVAMLAVFAVMVTGSK